MYAASDISKHTFIVDVYSRAESFFARQKNGRYASGLFYSKMLALILFYGFLYWYFLFQTTNISQLFFTAVLLGISHVLIPVNISHDAVHGSVSRQKWINDLGMIGFDLTGGNSFIYRRKHLQAHLEKENGSKTKSIESQKLLMRKTPLIAYLFYAQYMLIFRDFLLFLQEEGPIPFSQILRLIFFKTLYFILFGILPFIFIPHDLLIILSALCLMYFVITVLLVLILLMPTEKTAESKLLAGGTENDRWAMEVLNNNVDFSPESVLLNQIAGGSNLNVVHYLFPDANHVHYNALAKIISETAAEHHLNYRRQSVKDVVAIHFNYLKNIGHAHE